MRIAISIVVVAAAMLRLGWLDGFHLLAGGLAITLTALVWVWWKRHREPAEPELKDTSADMEEGSVPDPSEHIRNTVLGVLLGAITIGTVAASSAALKATPVYAYFYDTDCLELLDKAQTLRKGGAHAYALDLVEKRLGQRGSSGCLARLSDQRVRLLLLVADGTSGRARESRLQAALGQAEQLGNRDLAALIRARIDLEAKQTQIEQLQNHRLVVQDFGDMLAVDLPDVLFDPGLDTLSTAAAQFIPEVAALIRTNGSGKRVIVEGHTDNTGSPESNESLGRRRAESVKHALVTAGVNPDRVTVESFGDSRPVAGNDTTEGRAKNRRVRIRIPK